MMTCRMVQSQMAGLLLEPGLDSELEPGLDSGLDSKRQPAPAAIPAAVREHAATCAACQAELAALRRTMALLDTWQAPEPSPYFDGRLQVRLREEQRAAPAGWLAGWLERLRARLLYGNGLPLGQLTAGALAAVLAVAGGTVALEHQHQASAPAVQASATVRDLQSYDGNAQVFQQLSSLDADEDTGSAAN